MAWQVTVHTSNAGHDKVLDFRAYEAKTHKRALELAIMLAAYDAAMHATWLTQGRTDPVSPMDERTTREHEQKRDALLGLVATLTVELYKPAKRRWYNSRDCERFSFEQSRLAFASFNRV